MKILFKESAAPLKQVQKSVTSGIEISPAIAGTWTWMNDRELRFTPKNDWPVDVAFTLRLAAKVCSPRAPKGVVGPSPRFQPTISERGRN
jgi:hypothetical protein